MHSYKKKVDHKTRKMTHASKISKDSYEELKIVAEREHKLNSHTRNAY